MKHSSQGYFSPATESILWNVISRKISTVLDFSYQPINSKKYRSSYRPRGEINIVIDLSLPLVINLCPLK